eukprot:NODE_87_length_21935_cov_0.397142.p6 type:complete len:356 gc:universal NODE_87_length_21935_cov_0.397142:14686-13619(-)
MDENEFFDDNFEFPQEVLEDIERAKILSNPIANETDYSDWNTSNQIKPQTIVKTHLKDDHNYSDDLLIAKKSSKLAIKKLKSGIHHNLENYLIMTCQMVTSNIDLLSLIDDNKRLEDISFCSNVLRGCFVSHGHYTATSNNKKIKAEKYKCIDQAGTLVRFLVEYSITHSYLSNSDILSLILQFSIPNFATINSNLIYSLHAILNIERNRTDEVIELILDQNWQIQLQHIHTALDYNKQLVEAWIIKNDSFYTVLRALIDVDDFVLLFNMIIDHFGPLFVNYMIKYQIKIFNWFLDRKYMDFIPALNSIQDLALKIGGTDVMLSLFENDDSVLNFVKIFESTDLGKDPIGFMKVK